MQARGTAEVAHTCIRDPVLATDVLLNGQWFSAGPKVAEHTMSVAVLVKDAEGASSAGNVFA